MKNIATALVKAQKGFSPALKSSTNPHFKSRYADLSACVEAVIDALNNNGIALIQKTVEDSIGVTVETVFLHESGEMIECGKLHVPASKQDPQGYGSALTYARRYSLMAACGIAPEDDDGNAASHQKNDGMSEVAIARHINLIKSANNLKELQENYTAAYRAAKNYNNDSAMESFANAKNKRKNELTEAA
jgi:hypothetical protein